MTQKYLLVRREMYEKNPVSKMRSTRSFSDMVKLFKYPYWIMLGVLIASIVAILAVAIFTPKSLLLWPFMSIVIIVSILSQIPRETHFYKEGARQEELEEKEENYQLFITEILKLLERHNVNTPEMISQLKLECEAVLKTHEKKYQAISNRVIDLFIGVPLGALVASVIYVENNVTPVAICFMIFAGFAISGLIKLIRSVFFYSDGYFKDKYLLDTLNELNYSNNLYKPEK